MRCFCLLRPPREALRLRISQSLPSQQGCRGQKCVSSTDEASQKCAKTAPSPAMAARRASLCFAMAPPAHERLRSASRAAQIQRLPGGPVPAASHLPKATFPAPLLAVGLGTATKPRGNLRQVSVAWAAPELIFGELGRRQAACSSSLLCAWLF